jgi:hypothetical protein
MSNPLTEQGEKLHGDKLEDALADASNSGESGTASPQDPPRLQDLTSSSREGSTKLEGDKLKYGEK